VRAAASQQEQDSGEATIDSQAHLGFAESLSVLCIDEEDDAVDLWEVVLP